MALIRAAAVPSQHAMASNPVSVALSLSKIKRETPPSAVQRRSVNSNTYPSSSFPSRRSTTTRSPGEGIGKIYEYSIRSNAITIERFR